MTLTPATASIWQPLASESQRAAILPILEELELAFGPTHRNHHPCLSGGTAGTALYFGYLSKLPGKEGLKERAMNLLGQAVEEVGKTRGADFYSGYTGIAWTVEHLQQLVFDCAGEKEEEDANAGVDEVLSDLLGRGPWRQDYDLISGLVGYGVYALERLSKPSARQVLSRVLDHLEAMVVPCAVGHSWLTPPELLPAWQREQAPKGYFNLGLAHGVPGVLLMLAAMERAGQHFAEIDSQRAKKVLEGGMSWLFGQFQPPEDGSYLTGWYPVDQEAAEPRRSRVAWCYGDLGASLAVLNAARLAGRIDWESKALDMARLAAARPLETSGVFDTSLCHGSAGNLVIFQRWFQLTGEACFRQAAQMYLDHLISTRDLGGPFAGYTTYKPATDEEGKIKEEASPYKPDPGVLEGAAGAGLALLSALGIEPKWDRFMMLSLPDLF